MVIRWEEQEEEQMSVGDGIFEAVKCVIISPASLFLIIQPWFKWEEDR